MIGTAGRHDGDFKIKNNQLKRQGQVVVQRRGNRPPPVLRGAGTALHGRDEPKPGFNYCCLYDNSEDKAIIRRIDRDMDYERELIALEQDFWENHVLAKLPPPYWEDDGKLIL